MGVGFAKDGEGAMRNNRKLKNATKDKYFKTQQYKSNTNNALNHKPVSEEELNQIRKKLETQNQKANRRAIIAVSITIMILAYLIFF